MSHYDILIIGSGEAGKFLGWTLASNGKRTGCIERKYLGGSCPNTACLPSKNFIHSASVVYDAAKADRDGLFSANARNVNMSAVKKRKQQMVDGLVDMHASRFESTGLELIKGHGRFVGPKTIAVEGPEASGQNLTADTIVISTGSRTRIPSTPGLNEAQPLTHIELLDIELVPPHLAILGGGYIAFEFAQCMRRLGSQVTVITDSSRLLPREDEDVASALRSILEGEGVAFHTSTRITSVSGRSGTSVTLAGTSDADSSKSVEITATHLLLATGRVPNTDDLDLEKAGIATTKTGHIDVDTHLRSSSAAGVFAVGDCAGSPHFTHVAYDDYRIVDSVLSADGKRETTGRQVPYTLFTSPELARVGLSEAEVRSKGLGYRVAKLPMAAFLRTRTLGETDGFVKLLVGDDDRILGFVALGSGAGELLPVVQLAMKEGLPYTSIADLVLTHPTLGEGLTALFGAVAARK